MLEVFLQNCVFSVQKALHQNSQQLASIHHRNEAWHENILLFLVKRFHFGMTVEKKPSARVLFSMTFLKKKHASPLRFLHRRTDTVVLGARGNL
jgi:hypothetical protein